MISSTARQTFDRMVQRAILASPLIGADVQRSIEAGVNEESIQTQKAVVLTVSSYVFRLTLLIHFSEDEATRAHFAAVNRVAPQDLDAQAFMDSIRECGNICCGNLNRDLVRVFPHVGMSTPNIIDRRCMAYLGKLGQGYVQHFGLLGGEGPALAVTVCVNEFADLDFSAEFEEAETTGELEMF
jgi:CheY-specific phosphatase CheX